MACLSLVDAPPSGYKRQVRANITIRYLRVFRGVGARRDGYEHLLRDGLKVCATVDAALDRENPTARRVNSDDGTGIATK
jgi:hypothetical protein